MDKEYQVVKYTKNTHHGSETRFCIISAKTGEVLDDAQGYGYKTAQKAHAAYAYKFKRKDRSYISLTLRSDDWEIEDWMYEHPEFVESMDSYSFEIAKGSWGKEQKFNTAFVEKLLRDSGLEFDFPAKDLLRVWKKVKRRQK